MATGNYSDLPLYGVKIVEFCSVAAGPFCGMLLADMGAEVLKIEPPDGDTLRQWPPITEGFSENFASLNRNKHSLTLNLKDEQDRQVAKRLVLQADVLIENNRPGVMDRLGLGVEAFKADHPDLVYCSISAFGQEGPRAHEGGFDLTIQAASGLMSVTGEAGGTPVKCGVPVSDFASGLYAAFSIACVLLKVKNGQNGSRIDIPMFGCTLGIAALQTSEYFGTGKSPQKLGAAHPRNAPYEAFRAKDGDFVIAAGNQKLWHAVCDMTNLPHLLTDPRFTTTLDRAKNQAALKVVLEETFTTQPTEYWIDACRIRGIPHARINDYETALNDPQVEHMQWVQQITLPNGVGAKTFISPIRIDGKNLPIRLNPPEKGESNNKVEFLLDQEGGSSE